MDDEMIDMMAGDVMLRRRLEAYAESRLSPDFVASSRMRARVLAIAHRQADLARADTALTILPGSQVRPTSPRATSLPGAASPSRRAPRRRAVTALLAATLGLALMAGTALAARPGGGLYDARLWLETITLPSDPSARAVAELGRLGERIREAREAAQAGDQAAAAAALAAYGQILDAASVAAIASGDAVAAAAFETGVGQNIAVLQEIFEHAPIGARGALEGVIDRAVERSGAAIDAIETTNGSPGNDGHPGNPGNNGTQGDPGDPANNGNPAIDPADRTPKPIRAPTPPPTVKPPKPAPTPKASNGSGPGGPVRPDPTPRKTPPAQGD